jgi:hypothetical protein
VSHEVEWQAVLDGSQVRRNGFTWVVESGYRSGPQVTLYSPEADKRHTGTPPKWNKVEVLLPDDRFYVRSHNDLAVGMGIASALVTFRLGGEPVAMKIDDQWTFQPFGDLDDDGKRLHLLLAHRISSVALEPSQLDEYHDANPDRHAHGRIEP